MNIPIKETIVTILAAFGVLVKPEEFFAGLMFALSLNYMMAEWFQEKDERELWMRLVITTMIAILIAGLHPIFLATWPVAVKMAIGGAFSIPLVTFAKNFMAQLVAKGADVVDKVIDKGLPK